MVARTAYTQLNYSPLLLILTLVGMTLIYIVPALGIILGALLGNWGIAFTGLLTWLLMSLAYLPTIRFYKCPVWLVFCLKIPTYAYVGDLGHGAWGRQCGLGVGPAWSICRHGAWGFSSGERGKEKRVKGWSYLKIHSNISNYFFPFSLSPLTRVPSEKCPLNNCPLPRNSCTTFLPTYAYVGDSSRFFVECDRFSLYFDDFRLSFTSLARTRWCKDWTLCIQDKLIRSSL
jgi:hypothetical protein